MDGTHTIIYKKKGELDFRSQSALSGSFEPLAYPLLFIRGEDGWAYRQGGGEAGLGNIADYITFRELMPDLVLSQDGEQHLVILARSASGTRTVRLNRFTMFTSLAQMYFCDMVSRMIDQKLNFMRRNQPTFRRNDEMEGAETVGVDGRIKKTYLSDSHHGSRRHVLGLSRNALRIVAEYGKPTFFLTVTCNPRWSEILDNIAEGQTAFNRPGVTIDVFKCKLAALLHNLRAGKYFKRADGTPAPVVYIVHVIEYQQRGMPHAHIVFRVVGMPEDRDEVAAYVNAYITAEFVNCQSQSDEEYRRKVKEHMIHKCWDEKEGGCKRANGTCKRGYGNVGCCTTSFDSRGFPQYRRRECHDEEAIQYRVVPHNREILMDWNGHANLEFCGDAYTVTYLYKYLFKGQQMKKVKINGEANKLTREQLRSRMKDEIRFYLYGRYAIVYEC